MDDGVKFSELVASFEKRIIALSGKFVGNDPASDDEISRAEEIYGHALPDEVKFLYRRYNGTSGSLPLYGSFIALPKTFNKGLEDNQWAAGVPFGLRDHMPLVFMHPWQLSVALNSEHRGEIWKYVLAGDSEPAVRVANSVSDMFSAWSLLLDDGIFDQELRLVDDFAEGFEKLEGYWPRLNPLLVGEELGSPFTQARLAECGGLDLDDEESYYASMEQLSEELEQLLQELNGEPEPYSLEQVEELQKQEKQRLNIMDTVAGYFVSNPSVFNEDVIERDPENFAEMMAELNKKLEENDT